MGKRKIWAYCVFSIVVILSLVLLYLVQPSGQLKTFQPWIYQAHQDHKMPHYQVKFFGVSTLLFDDGKQQVLVDGFFSRPSLAITFLKKIDSDASKVDQIIQSHNLKRTQAILVTHSHYDHALDVPFLAHQLSQAKIVGSNSTLNIARGANIPETQLQRVQAWQPMKFGAFTVTAIPSQHTPPTVVNNDLGEEITTPLTLPTRFPSFKEGGSFDYLIQHGEHVSLVKASTGAIPKQFQHLKVDTLFLGIAQLSKQSEQFQQNYLKETLATLQPKTVIPIHWDNFFTPIEPELEFLPHFADNTPKSLNRLIQAAEQQHVQVVLLSQPVSFELKHELLSKISLCDTQLC